MFFRNTQERICYYCRHNKHLKLNTSKQFLQIIYNARPNVYSTTMRVHPLGSGVLDGVVGLVFESAVLVRLLYRTRTIRVHCHSSVPSFGSPKSIHQVCHIQHGPVVQKRNKNSPVGHSSPDFYKGFGRMYDLFFFRQHVYPFSGTFQVDLVLS